MFTNQNISPWLTSCHYIKGCISIWLATSFSRLDRRFDLLAIPSSRLLPPVRRYCLNRSLEMASRNLPISCICLLMFRQFSSLLDNLLFNSSNSLAVCSTADPVMSILLSFSAFLFCPSVPVARDSSAKRYAEIHKFDQVYTKEMIWKRLQRK